MAKVCLLDDQYRPKPAWERLRRLIREEWNTRVSATASDDGRVRFRGFYGTYEVQVTDSSRQWRFTFALRRNQPARHEFILDVKPDSTRP